MRPTIRPSPKHPEIERKLEQVAGRTTAIKGMRCVRPPIGCGQPIAGFRDQLSADEYRISGFCQECQDSVFGP